jgi:DNA invertase Pin-like site-specific DNA recombinase
MCDGRTSPIKRVASCKPHRLGRSLGQLALTLDELTRLKVPLVRSSQGTDTSDENPAGWMQAGVLMAVAEFERSLLRDRVNSATSRPSSRCKAGATGSSENVAE